MPAKSTATIAKQSISRFDSDSPKDVRRLPSHDPERARRLDWIIVLVSLAFVAGLVGAVVWNMTAATGGQWVFSLDDAYIHLAMARTMAESGTWGITPGVFSATSSSPLYLALLATAFWVSAPSIYWAWALASLGGLMAVGLLAAHAGRMVIRREIAVIITLFMALGAGLPEIMLTGMEHALHITSVLVILICLHRRLDSPTSDWRTDIPLATSLLIAGALRFESLFVLAAVAGVLWIKGMRRTAFLCAAAGLLPPLALGIFQLTQGAMILPNSVALKGVMVDANYLSHLTSFRVLLTTPEILIMLVASLAWWVDSVRRGSKSPTKQQLLSLVFVVTVLLHGAFGRAERRYIGYLLVMGFWTLLPAFHQWGREMVDMIRAAKRLGVRSAQILSAALVITVLVLPFVNRAWEMKRLLLIGQDIYSQQVQMARFLSEYYPRESVGLNDIGTTAWAGQNPILDFWGLANNDIARMRMRAELTPDQLSRLAREHNVEVIAIYSHWFLREKGLPDNWRLVGRWQIPSGLMTNAASNAVDFFATSPEAASRLSANLRDFSPRLPETVRLIQ